MPRLGHTLASALFAWLVGVSATAKGDAGAPAAPVASHDRSGSGRAFELAAFGGIVAPVGHLDPGPLFGVAVTVTPVASVRRLRLTAGFDWSLLDHQQTALFAPTAYPRAQGELIQRSQLFTLHAGASYALAVWGWGRLDTGVGIGAIVNRSEFEAFSSKRDENDVRPVGIARAAVSTTRGHLIGSVEASFRTTWFDLGQPGEVGEDRLTALVITIGVGARL